MAHPLLHPGEPVNGERRLVKTAVDKPAEVLLAGGRVRNQNTKQTDESWSAALPLNTRYGNTDCRSTTSVASCGKPEPDALYSLTRNHATWSSGLDYECLET
ncbi:unnamed protein product [Fusarium venenatum]|uniref:Uncharacterized protein n=1 Tax=Fusarium venenatum TaxID=56646 RepID=A0A2L2TZD3_9HYPO|nr:uncharacterized protein FVRRES_03077 [Fusarium venenatum]CEI66565.1 unnamed protein product [Fusarium venenatum]